VTYRVWYSDEGETHLRQETPDQEVRALNLHSAMKEVWRKDPSADDDADELEYIVQHDDGTWSRVTARMTFEYEAAPIPAPAVAP